jgi:hypothetical protein
MIIPRVLFAAMILFFTSFPVFSESFYILGTYFSPNGRSDIFEQNRRETTFDVDDLNDFGFTIGYDHFVGDHFNVGVSGSFYREDAVGQDRVFRTSNGAPVERNFRLKLLPIEFNARALPLGRDDRVIVFVGGGIGYYFWDYEEVGAFVIDRNSTNPRIVTGSASSDGRTLGFNIHGGIEIPMTESSTFMIEVKHLYVDDDLDRSEFDPDFEPIDLSAILYSAGFSFWFD